jgi:hypothetical protein
MKIGCSATNIRYLRIWVCEMMGELAPFMASLIGRRAGLTALRLRGKLLSAGSSYPAVN